MRGQRDSLHDDPKARAVLRFHISPFACIAKMAVSYVGQA